LGAPVNVHTISRLPSAAYVIQRILTPETVGSDKTHKAHWPVAQAILDALAAAGWRLVPGRAPEARHHEVAPPPMVEGQLTTRQLINSAAVFDDIDEDLFTAAEFVWWLAADIKGSPEYEWIERRQLR